MSESGVMHFSIYRYNPETDTKPYMKEYVLDPKECRGKMLLDGLSSIKRAAQSSPAGPTNLLGFHQ